jgi:hypothetical protein
MGFRLHEQINIMTESNSPIVTKSASSQEPAFTRGYFNSEQLDDLLEAVDVLAAARLYQEELNLQDITADYINGFESAIGEARTRSTQAGTGTDTVKTATSESAKAAATLHTALQKIQSSAKQKHRMLAEDGDPATNFHLDGYLIGVRLNASRALLLQSAETLLSRAAADDLPGFRTPDRLATVRVLLEAYKAVVGDQHFAASRKELARLDRDELVHIINTRRLAIQHAADAGWPRGEENNRPIRKLFRIPLNRTLN